MIKLCIYEKGRIEPQHSISCFYVGWWHSLREVISVCSEVYALSVVLHKHACTHIHVIDYMWSTGDFRNLNFAVLFFFHYQMLFLKEIANTLQTLFHIGLA